MLLAGSSRDIARFYIALHLAGATLWHHQIALRIYRQSGIVYALQTIEAWRITP